MNKAAYQIARSILRTDYIPVKLGSKWFRIYPPVISAICEMFIFNLPRAESADKAIVIRAILNNKTLIAHILSIAVTGRGRFKSIRRYMGYRYMLRHATQSQIQAAFSIIWGLTDGIGMFAVCETSKASDDTKTKVIGNNNLLGHIASFIDSLHLSYEEVVNKIPYQTLLMMSADKLRIDTSPEKPERIEMTGAEMMARRRGGNK